MSASPVPTSADTAVRPLKRRMIAAAIAAGFLIRLLYRSLRVTIADPHGVALSDITGIWCFWHNRALLVPAIYRSLRPRHKGIVLTSASRDGSFLARVAASFGLEAARGSSSRRGGPALKHLVRRLREGYDAGVTPDGPRGPRYKLQAGIVAAAALARKPVIPVAIDFDACWRLRSWDRFIIPKPFSRVVVRFGAPVWPAAEGGEALEAQRSAIEEQMRASLRPE